MNDIVKDDQNNSRMRRIHPILLELEQSEDVALQVLRVLAVDCVQFPSGGALCEQGSAEERSESDQRLRESIVYGTVHLEVVNGPLRVREGVVGPTWGRS
jgi:hypothetical protein